MEQVHTVNMRIGFLVLLLIAGIVNILGIYLLYQLKSKLKEHRLLLCFLSGTTIVIVLLESVYWIGEVVGLEEYSSRLLQVIIIIDLGVFCTYYLTLLVLTLDRLFAVSYPFAYKRLLNIKKIYFAMVACWISGTLSSIPFFFLDYHAIYDIYYKYIILALDGLILVTVLFTYVFILQLLFKRYWKEKRLAASGKIPAYYQKKSNCNCKFVRIFLLILTSFLIFVVIPDIYFVYRGVIFDYMSMTEEEIISLMWQINYILDPLVYIFFDPAIRKVLKRKICRKPGLDPTFRTDTYLHTTNPPDSKQSERNKESY